MMASRRVRVHVAGLFPIPDDLTGEIFTRLGLAEILRCAANCKRWLGFLADPDFLRRVGLGPSLLAGVFFHRSHPNACIIDEKNLRRPQFFGLKAGGGARVGLASFIRGSDSQLLAGAWPLASRRGLLLVRVMNVHEDRWRLRLAVCGPRVAPLLLPPLQLNLLHFSPTGFAILSAADVVGEQQPTAFFQVLLTAADDKSGEVCIHSYSSAAGSWSAPVHCPQVSGTMSALLRVVVTHGTVHFFYRDERALYTLGVSADLARVALSRIPDRIHARQLKAPCVAGGGKKLAFVAKSRGGVLELLAKQQDDGWLRTDLMFIRNKRIDLAFFAESRGAMLIVVQEEHGAVAVYTADISSRRVGLDKAMRPCSGRIEPAALRAWYDGRLDYRKDFNRPVLYEMEWSLPLSLLQAVGEQRNQSPKNTSLVSTYVLMTVGALLQKNDEQGFRA